MDLRSDFEYETAYPFNHLDLPTLSSAIDNDGADDFFGSSSNGLLGIKQEIMSPFSQTFENESSEISTSEFMTPMANNIESKYEYDDEDKENISKTPVNRQLTLENDSPNETIKVMNLVPEQIDTLNYAMKSMELSEQKLMASARKSVKFHDKPTEKVHPMETRLDTVVNTPTIILRSRSVIRKSQTCFSPAPKPDKKSCNKPDISASANENISVNVASESLEDHGASGEEQIQFKEPETQEKTVPRSLLLNRSPTLQPPPNLRSTAFTRPDNEQLSKPAQDKRKAKDSPQCAVPKTKKFVSMAEELYKFQRCTPNRFHSKPRGSTKFPCARNSTVIKNTVPQSPALLAKMRSRPVHYPTHQEKEEEELKEIKSHKVTALPFNPKVFKTPNLGKPIEKRPVTAIQPFHLTENPKTERAKTPTFNFSARPIPKGLLDGVTGLGEKAVPKLTDPVAPSFEQRRVASAKRTAVVISEKGDQKVMGQRAIYHFGTPNAIHRRPTEVAPFSFHERDKLLQEKKEHKIKQFIEEQRKKAEFHANPIPRSVGGTTVSQNNNAVLPNVPVMSMFLNDGYKERRENLIKAKKQEEENLLKKISVFKARPATVVRSRPFEVKKVELPPLEVEPFDFNTERRAKEWEGLESARKAKEDEMNLHRKQREEERAQMEAEEVARIRKERVHSANPVPKAKPFTIKTSDKELTVPVTPFRQQNSVQK